VSPAAARAAGRFLREPRQVVAALRLLVFAGLAMLGVASPPVNPFLFWVLTTIYGLTILGYMKAGAREFRLRRVKVAIFLFDVLMVSMLIVLRGHDVQGFMTAYFTLVLMAAVVEGLGNAILNAVLVSTVYMAVTHWGTDLEALLAFTSLSQFVFFFVIAVFMGHVAEDARAEANERRRAEFETEVARAELQTTSTELRQSTAELKAARESLRANDRLATLGMLSAGIAHELKNPLAAIHCSLAEAPSLVDELEAAIADGHRPDEQVAEIRSLVEDCGLATAQLHRVVTDLTNMARSGTAECTAVPTEEALEGVARMLRGRMRGGLVLEVRHGATRPVLADPGRLLQVLLNLAGNALDAMEPRGHGTLTLASEDAGPGRVALRVEDTGPGMTPEVRARMFEPFFTTKGPGKGTGLGLHIVGEIVKALSGSIECETRPGEGAKFRVELPAASPAAPMETSHGDGQDASRRGRRGNDPQGAQAHVAQRAV
jgi:C4-dicarboxylate-specific signal transduction histidine kinase